MRLLVYNIRYATGTGPAFHLPVPGAGYLRSSRQILERITDFIAERDPDIVGLIEVDTGSIRSALITFASRTCRSSVSGAYQTRSPPTRTITWRLIWRSRSSHRMTQCSSWTRKSKNIGKPGYGSFG